MLVCHLIYRCGEVKKIKYGYGYSMDSCSHVFIYICVCHSIFLILPPFLSAPRCPPPSVPHIRLFTEAFPAPPATPLLPRTLPRGGGARGQRADRRKRSGVCGICVKGRDREAARTLRAAVMPLKRARETEGLVAWFTIDKRCSKNS